MTDSNVSALAVSDNGLELNYVEKDGEILFTAEEIGKQLGYGDPAKAVSNLFNRNRNELKLYSSILKVRDSNQSSDLRVFTEEGVYIISMLARTNEAKKFRARVALLLRRLRGEAMQRQIELARQAALAEGEKTAVSRARAALNLSATEHERIKQIVRYRAKGLTRKETGKLLDLSHRTVQYYITLANKLGMGV